MANKKGELGRKKISLRKRGISKLMTISAAARFLKKDGYKNINRQTIYNMIEDKRIETEEVGDVTFVKMILPVRRKKV